MKTIGMIGGMSWSSTVLYYQALNEIVHRRLGGRHSAKLVLWSVNFAEHLAIHEEGGWQAVTGSLEEPAGLLAQKVGEIEPGRPELIEALVSLETVLQLLGE